MNLIRALQSHVLAHVLQQGAGAAGEAQHALQPLFRAAFGSWLTSVKMLERICDIAAPPLAWLFGMITPKRELIHQVTSTPPAQGNRQWRLHL